MIYTATEVGGHYFSYNIPDEHSTVQTEPYQSAIAEHTEMPSRTFDSPSTGSTTLSRCHTVIRDYISSERLNGRELRAWSPVEDPFLGDLMNMTAFLHRETTSEDIAVKFMGTSGGYGYILGMIFRPQSTYLELQSDGNDNRTLRLVSTDHIVFNGVGASHTCRAVDFELSDERSTDPSFDTLFATPDQVPRANCLVGKVTVYSNATGTA